MSRFEGKRVVITGGSRGIGLATASRFAAEGAHVVITGRSLERLNDAFAALGQVPNIVALKCDVTNVSELEALFAGINAHYGTFDVLVANAGVGQRTEFEKVTEAEFDRIMNANVKGAFFSVQKALPYLNPGSSVVLVGSNLSYTGWELATVYGASKAAVLNLTRSLASTLSSRGIRVNGVTPGSIRTAMLQEVVLDHYDEAEFVASELPMGFIGDPDDVAKVIAFLASDDARYILGEDILCDGGSTRL
ncbi:glucose 1-dehydrogenase [Mesorhizobium sp.]|uniref:SDR family NAD(P)-dependent oxidoreductase n=1 Tax=Mesorhizobium sp. TaxID=1871066 RepID=UPI000FE9B2A9|nr:glucose 1-dehydrogenase [Mesorhizobium sp.]RWC62399.1 MAG: glucose 1-dehydrogenase [Mesorhizobium sp.]RWC65706.1 MAG: glucose 1-dehydrogenase [Mesorhizobium sp.]